MSGTTARSALQPLARPFLPCEVLRVGNRTIASRWRSTQLPVPGLPVLLPPSPGATQTTPTCGGEGYGGRENHSYAGKKPGGSVTCCIGGRERASGRGAPHHPL